MHFIKILWTLQVISSLWLRCGKYKSKLNTYLRWSLLLSQLISLQQMRCFFWYYFVLEIKYRTKIYMNWMCFWGLLLISDVTVAKDIILQRFFSPFRKGGKTLLYLFSPVNFCNVSHDESWTLEHSLSCQPTPWPGMRFAWSLTGCNISGIVERELACPVILLWSSSSLGLSWDIYVWVALKRRI